MSIKAELRQDEEEIPRVGYKIPTGGHAFSLRAIAHHREGCVYVLGDYRARIRKDKFNVQNKGGYLKGRIRG